MKITISNIKKGMRYLRHYGMKEFLIRLQEKKEAERVPYEPWYENHKATEAELLRQRRESGRWKDAPRISIVVPLYCTKEAFLRQMIASVQAQSYENWQLCLADASPADADGSTQTGRVVGEYRQSDARIVYQALRENGGIAENTNAAIALSDGDWIAFMDHDDLLAPDALYEAVALMRRGPKRQSAVECAGLLQPQKEGSSYELIYTDEDKVDMEGRGHFEPHFKPDFNLDLLRSNNYITHFTMVSRALFLRVGGLRGEFDGAQDYDFILRCTEAAEAVGHVPRILYHWRAHQESTASNPFSKQYAIEAGRRAIAQHLERVGVPAEVAATKDMGFYTVRYPYRDEPLVSIIIPNKDETQALGKCLAAIERSSYQNYEVIVVENNSCEETFSYYRQLAPKRTEREGTVFYEGRLSGGQRLRIAVWREEFHYSRLNNFGESFAEGEYFVLMNNDIEMITPSWMEELLGTCQRTEVGAVGVKLYYPDNTVQHAGIVVGIGGSARGIGQNMFVGLSRGRSGYLHKASLTMDYSAVTAACMMVKRDVYEKVGGFADALAVAFNDVDFCLKVRALGLLVVYQPRVEAYHYESKSRGSEDTPEKVARFQREIDYMRETWIGILKNGDPYYNPNFSPYVSDYGLRDNRGKNKSGGR